MVTLRGKILAAFLFFLTCLTTTGAGAILAGQDPLTSLSGFLSGLPYSFTLMLILSAHEAGHYFVSRRYGVTSPLPWFIPAPTLIGTFGAVIRLPRLPGSRLALFDIALAGPIAGLIPSVIALAVGIRLSSILPGGAPPASGMEIGESLMFRFLAWAFSTGTSGDSTLLLSPVGFAGWVGLLVTALNLMPVGQLDGGHLAWALLGRKARRILWGIFPLLLTLGYRGWRGWWIWAGLLLLMGVSHPELPDGETRLPPSRVVWGGIALLIEVLVFVPDPLRFV
ncbi:MAG: site-2 protease family protein [Nitrospirae bacterium]|nr:site-2 protease family protein [Nitrospirota bacterium]MCL5285294.1 site-2 protease family protein [Nitrospirota bacterium]